MQRSGRAALFTFNRALGNAVCLATTRTPKVCPAAHCQRQRLLIDCARVALHDKEDYEGSFSSAAAEIKLNLQAGHDDNGTEALAFDKGRRIFALRQPVEPSEHVHDER